MALVLVVVLIGTASILAFSLVGTYESPFYWGVSVGDKFLYSINVSHYEHNEYYGYTYSNYLSLDGEQLIIQITELPNVAGLVSSSTFQSQVVEMYKISCRFSNGTELPDEFPNEFATNIGKPLSQSILPLGDWTLIDRFFLDEFPVIDAPVVDRSGTVTQCASFRLNESMYLGSKMLVSIFPNIATYIWEGWTAFDTGVPLVAKFYVNYPSCMFQARLNVTLTYNGTL
jgi:hypothetical protein